MLSSLDQFVRQWLIQNGFQGLEGQQIPEMNEELVTSISDRYIELYEQITGETFVKSDTSDVMKRVEENIKGFLSVNA